MVLARIKVSRGEAMIRFAMTSLLLLLLSACNILVSNSAQKTDSNFHPGVGAGSGAGGSTTPADLTDDDNTSSGFGGGTKVGVSWNTNSANKLIGALIQPCEGS
jgi:hypothetical protein